MSAWLLWLLALAAIVAEGVVLAALGATSWALQMPVVLAVYLGLRRDLVDGALVLCALFLPAEWFATGPTGVYSLGMLVVFFAAQAIRDRIQRGWGLPQVLIGAIGVALHQGVVWLVVTLWFPRTRLPAAVGWSIFPSVLASAAALWIVGHALERVDSALAPRRRIQID